MQSPEKRLESEHPHPKIHLYWSQHSSLIVQKVLLQLKVTQEAKRVWVSSAGQPNTSTLNTTLSFTASQLTSRFMITH